MRQRLTRVPSEHEVDDDAEHIAVVQPAYGEVLNIIVPGD
jgi:hypothetical protein